ncbi:hypothetical protein H2202_009972 [Exophiala xenobiotica]|nr:hypothetical protein H2202_009972 [Exophiala xenobiotica]
MIKDDADFVAGLPKRNFTSIWKAPWNQALCANSLHEMESQSLQRSRRSVGYDFHDLPSFLAVYYGCMGVLQTEDDFFDLCYSYLHKVHSQNVVHVEMFFDPQAHTRRGIAFSTVLGGYRRAIVTAQRELNISASLIMCFLRDLDPGWAMDSRRRFALVATSSLQGFRGCSASSLRSTLSIVETAPTLRRPLLGGLWRELRKRRQISSSCTGVIFPNQLTPTRRLRHKRQTTEREETGERLDDGRNPPRPGGVDFNDAIIDPGTEQRADIKAAEEESEHRAPRCWWKDLTDQGRCRSAGKVRAESDKHAPDHEGRDVVGGRLDNGPNQTDASRNEDADFSPFQITNGLEDETGQHATNPSGRIVEAGGGCVQVEILDVLREDVEAVHHRGVVPQSL